MKLSSIASLSLVVSVALAACGGTPSSPAPTGDAGAGADGGGGAGGGAFCARVRTLACSFAANCEAQLNPATLGVPASCRPQWNAFVACLDANAASISCAQVMSGAPAACATQYMAAEACGRMAQDGGGTAMADASDGGGGTPDAGPRPLPAFGDGEWSADVTYTLRGGNLAMPTNGLGMAFLAPAPIGAPANSSLLAFTWEAFLGAPGGNASCRVGLVHNRAAGTWTFSADPLLTEPCTIMPMAEATTTLTFTGARVARNVGGNLTVTLDVRGAGPRFMGTGSIEILWPAP